MYEGGEKALQRVSRRDRCFVSPYRSAARDHVLLAQGTFWMQRRCIRCPYAIASFGLRQPNFFEPYWSDTNLDKVGRNS